MPLEDLDLEFEDEEEQKKKRSDAVAVDVDLAFSATGIHQLPASLSSSAKADSSAPKAAPAAAASARPAGQGAPVKKLDDARAQARRPQPASPQPVAQGANALQMAPPLEADFSHLAQELEHTKFEARVQVAVAEHKTELLADVLSDVKLLDHQVHQWLVRINQKHPDLKNEVLAVKKLLADFAAKKRK